MSWLSLVFAWNSIFRWNWPQNIRSKNILFLLSICTQTVSFRITMHGYTLQRIPPILYVSCLVIEWSHCLINVHVVLQMSRQAQPCKFIKSAWCRSARQMHDSTLQRLSRLYKSYLLQLCKYSHIHQFCLQMWLSLIVSHGDRNRHDASSCKWSRMPIETVT